MTKASYKTEQRKDLLEYLMKNSSKYVNADDIEKEFKEKNISIGLTTIYRFLNSLEKQGKLRIEIKDHTKYYQYILDECKSHFHLKCKVCGKLIHLKCDDAENLKKHILKEHEFEIDSNSPIIGICRTCEKNKGMILA